MSKFKFDQIQVKQLISIWEQYNSGSQIVLDTKGNPLPNIDDLRNAAIKDILEIIIQFLTGTTNINEFKTSLDSYNKRKNLWGFTAVKGQMFFNQLVNTFEANIPELVNLLKELIQEPNNLDDALTKINRLEMFVASKFDKAKDRRKVAKPSSVGYFLSYFWQLYNPSKWPIFYTSLIRSFESIGIWKENENQSQNYKYFYELNESIKILLSNHSKKEISNWDVEHIFWGYNGNPHTRNIQNHRKQLRRTLQLNKLKWSQVLNYLDYLPPKINRLVEVGNSADKSKGSEYERLVAEIFNYLDFEVTILGQGTGRNPDAILKYREDNTAFIVDAKAYKDGYNLGIDDRAIKEYIFNHCPKLNKDGYKKIGFILVSNSFNSDFDAFINNITWDTEIKRFILLTSEALLYLFAYKLKDKLSLDLVIQKLIACGNPITADEIIREFDDV